MRHPELLEDAKRETFAIQSRRGSNHIGYDTATIHFQYTSLLIMLYVAECLESIAKLAEHTPRKPTNQEKE